MSGGSGKGSGCGGCSGAFFFGVLLILGLIVQFWAWILGAVGAVLAVWLLVVGIRSWRAARAQRRNEARARASGLLARAERQHDEFLRGDIHGLYGDYPPVNLDSLTLSPASSTGLGLAQRFSQRLKSGYRRVSGQGMAGHR